MSPLSRTGWGTPHPIRRQQYNEKVFLHECKRHTTDHVASTRYAALSNPDLVVGTPSRPGQGVPWVSPHHPDQVGGTPSRPGWGVPWVPPTIQTWDGVHPNLRWGTPPWPGMGYPPDLRWGNPSYLDLGWGTLLPRPEMGYPPTQTWDGVPPPT